MKHISTKIVDCLIARKLTLAVAESLTGGIVCSKICETPGASRVFLEGIVSYTNRSKISRLGVRSQTLKEFTAVSMETAKEMAWGADIGISTTGVAGPGEFDDDGNPRGLVYIGIAFGNNVNAHEYKLEGSRDEIRNSAGYICLAKLFEVLNEGRDYEEDRF